MRKKTNPPVAAVITMRTIFVKYIFSTEIVLPDAQNSKKRAKAVSAHGCPLATIWIRPRPVCHVQGLGAVPTRLTSKA